MKLIQPDTFLAMCLFEKDKISRYELINIRRQLSRDFNDIMVLLNPSGINQAIHNYGNSEKEKQFFEYEESSDIFQRGRDWNKRLLSIELFYESIYEKDIPIGQMISKIREY